jgi:hypothetical protein
LEPFGVMQISMTFTHLLEYINKKENHNPPKLKIFHQAILRLIQVISSLKDLPPRKDLIIYTLNNLAQISNAAAKQNIAPIHKILHELIEHFLGIEQEEFTFYYPKVRKLYAFLISKVRNLEPSVLLSYDIPPQELNITLHLLTRFYHEGEPQFPSSDVDFLTSNPQINNIRGRPIEIVAEEIRVKYCELDQTQVYSLYYPHLILDAGYNFTEAKIIADYLEFNGILTYQRYIQDETAVKSIRDMANTVEKPTDLVTLDWDFFLPRQITEKIQFCPQCGIPLPEAKIAPNGENLPQVCEICRDISFP